MDPSFESYLQSDWQQKQTFPDLKRHQANIEFIAQLQAREMKPFESRRRYQGHR